MAHVIEINKDFSLPLCVFGCVNNANGEAIEKEMRPWLVEHYNVVEVWHDGTQFEYPALREAKYLSTLYNMPCLYIHTRGAYNVWRTTIPTRRMWKEEFGNQWFKYQQLVDDNRPTIACPFADADGEHRYNGFVANVAAWGMADIQLTDNRMDYEHIWRGKDVRLIGTLIQSPANCIKKIRKYLYRNYE